MKIYSSEFNKLFTGKLIISSEVLNKLISKHKVYSEDVEDVLCDPYMVVIKSKRKQDGINGQNYEIYAETESGRVLFIVGRLFPDGNLYIITAYWADEEKISFYEYESEVLKWKEEEEKK